MQHERHQQLSMQDLTGLSRVISAALCDPSFAARLLENPRNALQPISQELQLTLVEYNLAIGITNATDIADFAARLHERLFEDIQDR